MKKLGLGEVLLRRDNCGGSETNCCFGCGSL